VSGPNKGIFDEGAWSMKAFWKGKGEKGSGDSDAKGSIPEDALFFNYSFRFDDGTGTEIRILLDPLTLEYLPQKELPGDKWTRLGHHKCERCPLEEKENPDCPVALSIEDLVTIFQEKFSYETAEITVTTNDRTYFKDTTMQKGLSSILGIVMVSSGCPIMAKLRPMVRLHLPFSSVLETTFRTTSIYLLGQFFLKKRGLEADFTFEGLRDIYKDVNMVNRGMGTRIRAMAGKDASINALIILDMFALDIPLTIEDQIADIETFFAPYFE
jgi:uncharacterized protein DUF6901